MLVGEEKKRYQREYMRRYMRIKRTGSDTKGTLLRPKTKDLLRPTSGSEGYQRIADEIQRGTGGIPWSKPACPISAVETARPMLDADGQPMPDDFT